MSAVVLTLSFCSRFGCEHALHSATERCGRCHSEKARASSRLAMLGFGELHVELLRSKFPAVAFERFGYRAGGAGLVGEDLERLSPHGGWVENREDGAK